VVQFASEAVASTRAARLIILDRDGVINHDSDQFIKSPDEWRPIPGSLEAIARMSHAGYRVAVCTNQSGIGRGLFDMATLNAIHNKMHRALAHVGGRVDAVFFCPHTGDANCECRKPHPAMMVEAGAASAPTSRACRASATACATCRPPTRPARSRSSC
jgi:histidinol-phosphate phosphatase family protein